MTFKNGAYLEYIEEKHREQLYAEYGKPIVEMVDKLNEMIARINQQDQFLKDLGEWADNATDQINKFVRVVIHD